jgi:hypothetical protein
MDYRDLDRIHHSELMKRCLEARKRTVKIVGKSRELLGKRAAKKQKPNERSASSQPLIGAGLPLFRALSYSRAQRSANWIHGKP